LAPVTADYTPKGKYETIAGINTCKRSFLWRDCGDISTAFLIHHTIDIVGPEDATKGIIDVYDIFGIWPQTIQGADRLSAQSGALVLVPDFFEGSGLDINVIPNDTEEKTKKVHEFLATKANPAANVAKILAIRKELTEKYPAIEGHWGLFGLCWGGKLAVLACGEGNEGVGRRFEASGTAHPG
jgi:dienelactone hydrolase